MSLQNRDMSGADHEMLSVMQRVVFAAGLLEAKSAQVKQQHKTLFE